MKRLLYIIGYAMGYVGTMAVLIPLTPVSVIRARRQIKARRRAAS